MFRLTYDNLVHPRFLGVLGSCDQPIPGPFPAPPPSQGKGPGNEVDFLRDGFAIHQSCFLHLPNEKCKELRISFARNEATFEPIRVHGKELEHVDSAKLLGMAITRDLSWNTHVNDVIKKAAKRLYFLAQLKRATVRVILHLSCKVSFRLCDPCVLLLTPKAFN